MQKTLENKSAIVTGSTTGIGLTIAKRLHKQGCRVVLSGRSEQRLLNAQSEMPGSITFAGDLSVQSKSRDIIEFAEMHFGQLDFLVCNVGSGASVPPGEETLEEWQRVFAVNLWTATNMVQAATPILEKSSGAIVCVSSICGINVIDGAPVTYSAAKAALNSFVRGISRPLAKKNIRINAVAPGNILFEGSSWSKKIEENAEAVTEMLSTQVPQKTFGEPRDVASAVSFLLSCEARFVTGAVLPIDGGQLK